jgi:hypothetical protein
MNPYLAKLREKEEDKPYPEEPSKPSKRVVPVVTHENTTAERGFDGFESDGDRHFSANERARQASGQTPLQRLCRTFYHLQYRCPDLILNDRWQDAIEDGRRFLAQWGRQAEALGWTACDLFGLASVPENPHPSFRRLSRYDQTGLIWLLQGRPVVALTKGAAAIENPTGGLTFYRRLNKPALGPFGDSLDDFA